MDRREPWRFRDHVAALTDYLTGEGVLSDSMWRTALQEVPRHLFVPDRAYAAAMFDRGSSRIIDRKQDVTDWWNACYTNCSIVTQRDEGATDVADQSGTPTCSLSCPSIAMAYLHLLDVDHHHRVLEVGTGTGWTAGMLAWRLGGKRVVSVEVDEALSKTAGDNLAAAGMSPHLLVGDGAEGYADGVPYDRVHVTCGIRDIPHAWIAQTRPGGRIVAPYMPRPGGWGFQLVLDILDDETAIGRFAGGGGFMMLRSQRLSEGPEGSGEPDTVSTTRMDPRLIDGASDGALLALTALCPSVYTSSSWCQGDGEWTFTVRLADIAGTSWATCSGTKGAAEYHVAQSGPRRLWDEAQGAYMWWLRAGKPGRDRFGITVTEDGQRIWLDSPDSPLR